MPDAGASRRRKRAFYLTYWLAMLLLAVAVAETGLRLKGLTPWRPEDPGITVEPGNKLFQPAPVVGYKQLPGGYTITLPTGYSFHITHGPDTYRVTSRDASEADRRDEIWILGCSFTYGWAVNDEQTYPWLLQERFPQYRFTNFAVNGYGTLHSYLQLEQALASGRRPKYVVNAYASFHDERNVFARIVRKYIVPWNRLGPMLQPYARLNDDGTFRYAMADVVFREFPLMRRSALLHYLETQYDEYERQALSMHAVSEAILRGMNRLAKKHGAEMILAEIGYPAIVGDFARREGIRAVDISLDPSVPENTNMPHDSHPSAAAHRHYADSLERTLDEALAAEASEPAPLPRRIETADTASSDLLGEGWYAAEGGQRWMGRQATVTLAGPESASGRLRVRGYSPAAQVADGPVRLSVRIGERLLGSAELRQPDAEFEFDFPLPASTVGQKALTVTIEVDHTFRVPPDQRELGALISSLAAE